MGTKHIRYYPPKGIHGYATDPAYLPNLGSTRL